MLFSASDDRSVAVYSFGKKWSYLYSLSGHDAAVTSLAMSPTAKVLASGSSDFTVRIWYDYRIGVVELIGSWLYCAGMCPWLKVRLTTSVQWF